jgi:hypothetical protein
MRKLRDYKSYSIRGMEIDRCDINKLSIFQAESYKHFVAKCVLVYSLRKLGHEIATEVPIPGLGVADIIDLTTNTQYEIELTHARAVRESKAEKYRRSGVEIIVVDGHDMPENIDELRKFIEPYIRVD